MAAAAAAAAAATTTTTSIQVCVIDEEDQNQQRSKEEKLNSTGMGWWRWPEFEWDLPSTMREPVKKVGRKIQSHPSLMRTQMFC
jgi:hypothetical protein